MEDSTENNVTNGTHNMWDQQHKMNFEMLQQLILTQDYLRAKGKKGFRFSNDPEQYESLVTIYDEKTNSANLTDKEKFTILGSLLEGDAEVMYKRQLCIKDKTIALERVWRGLELEYGYRVKDSLTKIYERSNGSVVENSTRGLKELQKDLIFCIGKVGKNEMASLDNPWFGYRHYSEI